MAKQAIYCEEARRMFVEEGLTISIIIERLGNKVGRRTLDGWRRDGGWDDKRKGYLKATDDIGKELMEIAKLTIQNAKADPNPQNVYAMLKAVGALKTFQGVKVLEEEMTPKERKVLTGKTLEEIEKEHHIL